MTPIKKNVDKNKKTLKQAQLNDQTMVHCFRQVLQKMKSFYIVCRHGTSKIMLQCTLITDFRRSQLCQMWFSDDVRMIAMSGVLLRCTVSQVSTATVCPVTSHQ